MKKVNIGMLAEGVAFLLLSVTSYAIMGHRLDIYGLCPECQAASKSKE